MKVTLTTGSGKRWHPAHIFFIIYIIFTCILGIAAIRYWALIWHSLLHLGRMLLHCPLAWQVDFTAPCRTYPVLQMKRTTSFRLNWVPWVIPKVGLPGWPQVMAERVKGERKSCLHTCWAVERMNGLNTSTLVRPVLQNKKKILSNDQSSKATGSTPVTCLIFALTAGISNLQVILLQNYLY